MAASVTDEQLRLVRVILDAVVPGAERLAFGSRLGPAHHRYSDLDIGILAEGPLLLTVLLDLEEAFAESDLPFRVDVVDLHRVSPAFRQHIEDRHEKL